MRSTRRLFVLRHAKSSWEDPALDDHDRPLAPRGRRAVAVLAEHLRAQAIDPQLVLCSSSRRTRETLEGIGVGGRHVIEDGLYAARAQDVLERLGQIPDDVDSVMVIGHNPTMQELVLTLASVAPDLVEVQAKFPTGALATLSFSGVWSELGPGRAKLTAFVRPKALARH